MSNAWLLLVPAVWVLTLVVIVAWFRGACRKPTPRPRPVSPTSLHGRAETLRRVEHDLDPDPEPVEYGPVPRAGGGFISGPMPPYWRRGL